MHRFIRWSLEKRVAIKYRRRIESPSEEQDALECKSYQSYQQDSAEVLWCARGTLLHRHGRLLRFCVGMSTVVMSHLSRLATVREVQCLSG